MTTPPTETRDLSSAFLHQLRDVASRLRTDPLALAQVMYAESGMSAAAENPASGASGLIQFMPFVLASLGYGGTPAKFRQLSASEQLPFVEAYLARYARAGIGTVTRLYQAVFLPASLNYASAPADVICPREDMPDLARILRLAYDGNRSADIGAKGYINVDDLEHAVLSRCAGRRWDEIQARLQDLTAPSTPIPGGPAPTIADALAQLRVMHALVSTGDFYRRGWDLRDLHPNDKAALRQLAEAANAPV